LQHQGVLPNVGWDWGPLQSAPHLPRVVAGSTVLSRARWLVEAADLKTLDGPTPDARFEAVQALREKLHLPRTVVVSDSDNELWTDLDNALSVETFAHLIRRRRAARRGGAGGAASGGVGRRRPLVLHSLRRPRLACQAPFPRGPRAPSGGDPSRPARGCRAAARGTRREPGGGRHLRARAGA